MARMKQYDSIEYYGDNWGIPIIAFDKLDGSNLRLLYGKQDFCLCISKEGYAEDKKVEHQAERQDNTLVLGKRL